MHHVLIFVFLIKKKHRIKIGYESLNTIHALLLSRNIIENRNHSKNYSNISKGKKSIHSHYTLKYLIIC